MSNWKGIIGKSFSPAGFSKYCSELKWVVWKPTFIVLHNTAMPGLQERPQGFTDENMKDLELFYRDQKKWNAGPHLFIDDRQIWVFTPLTIPGMHSPSWNHNSLGIDLLGNYDYESFSMGRGLRVRKNAVAAITALSKILELHPFTIKLHWEDPLTTHSCPGRNVKKLEVVQEVYHQVHSRDNQEQEELVYAKK